MPKHAGHLVDISTLPIQTINEVVISQIEEGGHQAILSRYGDSRWDLSPYIATLNTRGIAIIFDIELGNGSLLTHQCNYRLLEAAKRFLYMRWRVKAPHSCKSACNNDPLWGVIGVQN